jgi:hypothetical protein
VDPGRTLAIDPASSIRHHGLRRIRSVAVKSPLVMSAEN